MAEAVSCLSLERCSISRAAPEPLLDNSLAIKAAQRPRLPGINDMASIQEILDSVLRQERALREEHARLRTLVQQHHDTLSEKIDAISSSSVLPASVSSAPEPKLAISAGTLAVPTTPGEPKSLSSGNQGLQAPVPAGQADETVKKAKQMKIDQQKAKEEADALARVMKLPKETATGLQLKVKRLVTGHNFEFAMGAVILLNMLTTAVQLQWQGYAKGHILGFRDNDANWSQVKVAFDTLTFLFNLVYLVELILRLFAIRLPFFKSVFNLLDTAIVVSTCAETFIIEPFFADAGTINLSALRIMRFFRVFRMGRVTHLLHTMENLREMRILIQTLIVSVRGLVWSVILIGGIILASSVIIAQLSHTFLLDESVSIERRQFMYLSFGTTARACYSIFVCTFTTSWPSYATPYIEEVGSGFTFFFIPFVVLVNFAVIRVVAALFLKQTMHVADCENEAEESLRMAEKESIAVELATMFEAADTSKNGAISMQEFAEVLANPEVIGCLSHLDIEIDEAVALFGVLCADDGEADYEEFLNAALKVNSPAKTIDSLQILHQVLEMHKLVQNVHHHTNQHLQAPQTLWNHSEIFQHG